MEGLDRKRGTCFPRSPVGVVLFSGHKRTHRMYVDIEGAYQALQDELAGFNRVWPDLVVQGSCWQLPLLTEQKTPKQIHVARLDGADAVAVAKGSFRAFERDLGQAAGTVMRVPGVFLLSASVLDQVRRINALKDDLAAAIEATRVELGQVPAARPTIMRRALGPNFNTKQLLRHIQAFEGVPRLVVFTWAGHTSGGERIPVAKIREQLQAKAELRADSDGVSVRDTAEYQELRALVNMADDECLLKHKSVAPHPRAMFYFTESTRYSAMIHANLPAFVLAGDEGSTIVRPLKDFDRDARGAKRPDEKTRQEAIPGKDLFVLGRKAKAVKPLKAGIDVPATYAAKRSPD